MYAAIFDHGKQIYMSYTSRYDIKYVLKSKYVVKA